LERERRRFEEATDRMLTSVELFAGAVFGIAPLSNGINGPAIRSGAIRRWVRNSFRDLLHLDHNGGPSGPPDHPERLTGRRVLQAP
jgi:hypothetical protein